jgi:nitrogenase molybdenum-iron protein alpha/beta subunit
MSNLIPCRAEAEELRCAKQHLEQQLGRQVVAMIGHSKGATDVLLYTSKWDDLACVVNLAGRCDVQKGVLERLGPEVLEQLHRTGQVRLSLTHCRRSLTAAAAAMGDDNNVAQMVCWL